MEMNLSGCQEEKTIILGVHSLYAIDTFADWQTTDEYAKAQGYDTFEELLEDWGYSSEEEFLMDGSFMNDYSETENYADSVNENGGFYIGRYEASYYDEKVASKKSENTNRANSSDTLENGMLWNYVSQEDALRETKNMYTGMSTLLTGAAWDRTLGWLYETGERSASEIAIDSTSWGNYSNDEFSNTTGLINTGEYDETEKNHIYDLAGNLREWTTEAYNTSRRVYRGRLLLLFRF